MKYEVKREWKNLKVIEMDLPVEGCCCKWGKDSGEYRIFIDKALSEPKKLETFIHEMIHLYHGDLDSTGKSVDEVEARAHRETEEILKRIKA